MIKLQTLTMLPLSTLGVIFTALIGLPSQANPISVGEKGASVYCFMRNNGNNHDVSWDAAYQIIKRQKGTIFKTSPRHGAVMITETVVQNPEKYKGCGSFLGDLYSPSGISTVNTMKEEIPTETNQMPSDLKKGDRYSY